MAIKRVFHPTAPDIKPAVADYNLKETIAASRLAGLWRMMTGFRLTYVGATLALGFAALAKTGTYLVVRDYVDNVLGEGDLTGRLPLIALTFLALALFEGTFTFLSGRWAARSAEGITLRLRNYLFDHIQRLPFTYFDKTPTGELIQRATSDVDAMRRFFQDQAVNAGRIVLLFLVNFVAILVISWRLALLSVVVVPFILVISLFFFRRIRNAYEAYQEQEAQLSTTLQENLTGVRVVKAFARQDYEREKFERDNWEKFRRGRRLLMIHSVYWPVTDILCAGQMLTGFLIAALMAIDGSITVGTYLAYHELVIWIIWPMRNLGRLIVEMSRGIVSYQRVRTVIEEDKEPLQAGDVRPAAAPRGEITFGDVGFSYEEGSPILQDISFACKPGTVVALLGATGSGKTSLVNLLPRFYELTAGAIHLDAVPLSSYPRQYLREVIGIVEQEPFLFSRTIRDNITYGVERDVRDEEVFEAARAAAIHDVILDFPEGYDTLVGEKGVTLSGGQKQRVVIARTLLRNPRILILDDATSSVDTETEGEIRRALERLMQGRTTFVIAHRIQSVMSADLILVLSRGRIVQRGTHEQLLAQPGIYRQIFELQSSIEDELQSELAAGNGSEIASQSKS